MTEEFLVGCPLYKRAWALPQWFEHLENACSVAGVEPIYAFVVDPEDEETISAISDQNGTGYVFAVAGDHLDARNWGRKRFEWMVQLRNELLGIVRLVNPRLFLSLDSDIFLHRDALKNMMETIEDCDAVGGKTYMTENGTAYPSWANIGKGPGQGLLRYEADGVFSVQAIMAIKLMNDRAYNVDYKFHTHGEDIGWSVACREKGLKLKWDGRVASKHVMKRSTIDRVDPRVGF